MSETMIVPALRPDEIVYLGHALARAIDGSVGYLRLGEASREQRTLLWNGIDEIERLRARFGFPSIITNPHYDDVRAKRGT